MPPDLAVLSFEKLFNYYNSEFERAKFGLGDFQLKERFPTRATTEMINNDTPTVMKPNEIFGFIRRGDVPLPPVESAAMPQLIPGDDDSATRRAEFLVAHGRVNHVTTNKVG